MYCNPFIYTNNCVKYSLFYEFVFFEKNLTVKQYREHNKCASCTRFATTSGGGDQDDVVHCYAEAAEGDRTETEGSGHLVYGGDRACPDQEQSGPASGEGEAFLDRSIQLNRSILHLSS